MDAAIPGLPGITQCGVIGVGKYTTSALYVDPVILCQATGGTRQRPVCGCSVMREMELAKIYPFIKFDIIF